MTKLKCWRKLREGYKNKNGKILQIKKVNLSWEKPAHNVIIHDSNIQSYESSLGKVVQVKHLGKKSSALKFAKSYMKKHNKC